VYRLGLNGQWTLVPGTNQIGLTDGMAFAPNGDLYIADDVPGDSHIWRVTPGGSAQIWSSDPLIQGGANSIEVVGNDLYISVTDYGTMVKMPINPDGTAGSTTVVASDPSVAPVDDGVYDPVTGNTYLSGLLANEFVQITPSGATTVIANGPLNGLYTPTNLDFVQFGRHAVIYVAGSDLQSFGAPPNSVSELLKVTLR
jgi:glucose/arabinose dehydrogenase